MASVVQRTSSGEVEYVETFLPYMDVSVESSIVRNGKVASKRDTTGSDQSLTGVKSIKVPCMVHNARHASPAKTLEANGFQLLERPLRSDQNFYDNGRILDEYYHEVAELLKEACGAALVVPFDHNVRSAGGKASKKTLQGGSVVQGPAVMVHADYSLTSAPQRLRDLAQPPRANDTLRQVLADGQSALDPALVEDALANGRRWSIVNVWRNILSEPVQRWPLGVCDSQTVEPGELVVFEIHYDDRIGENYFAKHHPRHKWHYFPNMTRDEVLLLKTWDSSGGFQSAAGASGDSASGRSTFALHTAFADPSSMETSPDRESIEVRCIVFYDSSQSKL
eukprot:CAMPEP_0194493356 /NCGR_PEP_ID=MMETSP0253-20130528/11604_1 /TAXON_ID=2966 /ORGANISM="Noctiluca scintillans" /LENGTH=336 /DNA_ID=CAMNT_0039334335 /DNA_START=48 /DNA_END=1058 /DNA_ORIENTATION=-